MNANSVIRKVNVICLAISIINILLPGLILSIFSLILYKIMLNLFGSSVLIQIVCFLIILGLDYLVCNAFQFLGKHLKMKTYINLVSPVISEHFKAKEYDKITQKTYKYLPIHFGDMICSSYMQGNINKIIELSKYVPKNDYHMYYCATVITKMRAYLLVDDVENLKLCMKELLDFSKKDKASREAFEQIAIYDFFNYYIEKDYDKCLEIITNRKVITNFNKLETSFHLALIKYKLGEYDKAKEQFNIVKKLAPNTFYEIVSNKYLDIIDVQSCQEIDFSDVLAGTNENMDDIIVLDIYAWAKLRGFEILIANLIFILLFILFTI